MAKEQIAYLKLWLGRAQGRAATVVPATTCARPARADTSGLVAFALASPEPLATVAPAWAIQRAVRRPQGERRSQPAPPPG